MRSRRPPTPALNYKADADCLAALLERFAKISKRGALGRIPTIGSATDRDGFLGRIREDPSGPY
jgi:hypothetical protein